MKLLLIRKYLKPDYTIGSLSIDGIYFCDTIEDRVRDVNKDGDLLDDGEGKVFGETAIPYGAYEIELNISPKFGRLLPLLMDVPHFTGIRIHRGNTAKDSHGCILPGENKVQGRVINSTQYEIDLVRKIKEALELGKQVFIEIA